MKSTNNSTDPRFLVLDRMIQDEKSSFPPDLKGDDRIIDFIMDNADLALSAEQIEYLLWHSSPPFGPDREDYFDVLDRMISEAKNLGNTNLIKRIYMTIPFWPEDKDYERKLEFVQGWIRYFLSLGLKQTVGELYCYLAQAYVRIKERIAFYEQALGYLDRSSKEYAWALAIRKMLRHMECHANGECLHYCAFGEAVSRKAQSVFLSPMYEYFAYLKEAEPLYYNPAVLKGNKATLSSYGRRNDDKVIVDSSLPVGASSQYEEYGHEYELVRHPDEKVICRADGKEYVCHVFSYGRRDHSGEQVLGEKSVKNYFAPGVGLVRMVLSVDGKEYVYELCDYSVKGGDALLPLCVGNKWCYRQAGCPETTDQIIEREIVAQDGGEYLLSGLDYGEMTEK